MSINNEADFTLIENILAEELPKLAIAAKACSDAKAIEPMIFDVTSRGTFTDYILVCHATSDRHVKTIQERMEGALRKNKFKPIGIEGASLGQWILLDFGGLVANVFYEPLRAFYDIEGLWADCPQVDIEALEALADKEGFKMD